MRDTAPVTTGRIALESGVRRYARPTWRHWLRRRRLAGLLASVGESLYVERNVEFLRHPERVSVGSHVIVKEGEGHYPLAPKDPKPVVNFITEKAR